MSSGKALPVRYSQGIAVSICTNSSYSSHVQDTCIFSRMLSREIPVKILLASIA